jgi:hypothetical protein
MSHVRITLDPKATSIVQTIEVAANAGPLVVLTARMFRELAHELGSDDAAMRYVMQVSAKVDKPIGCNFPTDDGSRTAFMAPASWTQERLRGWVGARHEEITAMFGMAVSGPLEDL